MSDETTSGDLQESQSAALDRLHDALEFIPLDEKRAFVEAVQKVPHLVALESNPMNFLRFDNFDPWAASRRVVAYWNARIEVFGDRAYLPMTQSGQGALSDEDVQLLQTGHLMLLPDDKHGRAVVFHDRARLTAPEHLDMATRMRCLFYILSTAAESHSCRQNGVIYLTVYSDRTRKVTFDFKALLDGISFLKREVFPMRSVALHLVMLAKRAIMNKVVPMTLQAFQRIDYLTDRIIVHTGKPVDEVLEDLKQHGFDIEGIPKIPLDGLYTYGCFRRWMEKRNREERQRLGGLSSGRSEGSTSESLPLPDDDKAEEELRRKRETDAMYARRKRARVKIEQKVLQDEVERLTHQKHELSKVGESLTELLHHAHKIVESYACQPRRFEVSTTAQVVPEAAYDAAQLPQTSEAGYLSSFSTSRDSAMQTASMNQYLQSQQVVLPPATFDRQASVEHEQQQHQPGMAYPMLASLLQREDVGNAPLAALSSSFVLPRQTMTPMSQARTNPIQLPILPLRAPFPAASLSSSAPPSALQSPVAASVIQDPRVASGPLMQATAHEIQQQQLFQQLHDILARTNRDDSSSM